MRFVYRLLRSWSTVLAVLRRHPSTLRAGLANSASRRDRAASEVDRAWYLRTYPDIGTLIDPAEHYARHGWREGRDPSAAFSTSWYLISNPDIAANGLDPLHHYLSFGRTEGRSPKPTLLQTIRYHNWWTGKIPAFLAVAYATALFLHVPLIAIWPALVTLTTILAGAAAYASVVNDWTDRDVDAAAGKPNRMGIRSLGFFLLVLAGCLLPALLFLGAWRHDPIAVMLYLGTWIAFSLYSFPPVRLKYRGLPGPLCDAFGAHVCPMLLASVLVFRWADRPLERSWLVAVGLWAAGYGLRGILCHQRSDASNDAKAGKVTFVGQSSEARIARLESVLLLLEAAALSVLLFRSTSVLALAGFIAVLSHHVHARIVVHASAVEAPASMKAPPLFKFYELHLPLALLASSIIAQPFSILVAGGHLALFNRGHVRAWLLALRTSTLYRGMLAARPRWPRSLSLRSSVVASERHDEVVNLGGVP